MRSLNLCDRWCEWNDGLSGSLGRIRGRANQSRGCLIAMLFKIAHEGRAACADICVMAQRGARIVDEASMGGR